MQASPQKRPLPEDETEPEVWKYLEHTPTDYESKKHIRLRNAKTFLRIAKERENIKVGGNFFVVSERLTDTVLQDIELPPPPLPPVEILPLPPSPASLPFQAENSPNRPEKSANTTSFEKISVEFKENNMSENPVSPVDPSDRLRSRRRWIFDNDSQGNGGLGVRLVSYNVLAQNLLESNPQLYRNLNRAHLTWQNRWRDIQKEIIDFNPDIVCLQEVQFRRPNYFRSEFLPFFDNLGYRAVFKCRSGDKQDGCVIFYKILKFKMDCYSLVEYFRPGIPVLDRDNVGIVCRLIPRHREDLPKLVVGTTHLLFNRKRTDIRLSQIALFLAELDRLSTSNGELYPAIVCGDLNSRADSEVYRLLSEGHISYTGLPFGSRRMPTQLLPQKLGITDACQWETEARDRNEEFVYGTGSFSHAFNFKSIHQEWEQSGVHNKVVSTNHGDWTTVDFVFYTQARPIRLVSRLVLPREQDMQFIGPIPSDVCPSDHFPLAADFLLGES